MPTDQRTFQHFHHASSIIPYAILYYSVYLIDHGINIPPEGMQ